MVVMIMFDLFLLSTYLIIYCIIICVLFRWGNCVLLSKTNVGTFYFHTIHDTLIKYVLKLVRLSRCIGKLLKTV